MNKLLILSFLILFISGCQTTTNNENNNVLYITESGSYNLTGTYESIEVNVDKNIDDGIVNLNLENVNITTDDLTPINIIEAEDAVINLIGENTINQGEIKTDDPEFPSAALYSKADLRIIGEGSLIVNTSYRDGINSRDNLVIEDVSIEVNALEDGIVGKDFLEITNSNVVIKAGKDGLKSSNSDDYEKGNLLINSGTFVIEANNDGISAEQNLEISDGTFKITTNNGYKEVLNSITVGEGSGGIIQPSSQLESSMKALKANYIIINNGVFEISSYEDGIHANNDLTINNGELIIKSGDDAIHAENMLTINNGTIDIEVGYEGIESKDITINEGDITIDVLDDGINAASLLLINGGKIFIKSQGDGIDSNEDLTIKGGEIIIDNHAIYSNGDAALDVTGVYTKTGGTVTDLEGKEVTISENRKRR